MKIGYKQMLDEFARLDGCYALRTDLPKAAVPKEIVHNSRTDETMRSLGRRRAGIPSIDIENRRSWRHAGKVF
jgi:hypothetical protein